MILAFVLWQYRKDVKQIGKDRLAVSLGERLGTYFCFVFVPIVGILLIKIFG